MVHIRKEFTEDYESVYSVNMRAFGQDTEAKLVNRLREADALLLSLVALIDEQVVGHIAFSPVTITDEDREVEAIGLAPMAVIPEYQKKGIGSKLIEEGCKVLKEEGYYRVVVLGYAEYYSQFGFITAKKYGIRWEHECPDEAFMIKSLREGAFNGISGIVKFRPEFAGA